MVQKDKGNEGVSPQIGRPVARTRVLLANALKSLYPPKLDYAKLGERLKAQRKMNRFTQEEVAEAIGITPAFVGHIERGERSFSFETLFKFCNYYRVTVDYLLSDVLTPDEDVFIEQIKVLLHGKTDEQKTAIMDILTAVIRNIE